MDFETALGMLRQGKALRRRMWPASCSIRLVTVHRVELAFEQSYGPKVKIPWIIQHADVLGDDWELVNVNETKPPAA